MRSVQDDYTLSKRFSEQQDPLTMQLSKLIALTKLIKPYEDEQETMCEVLMIADALKQNQSIKQRIKNSITHTLSTEDSRK